MAKLRTTTEKEVSVSSRLEKKEKERDKKGKRNATNAIQLHFWNYEQP